VRVAVRWLGCSRSMMANAADPPSPCRFREMLMHLEVEYDNLSSCHAQLGARNAELAMVIACLVEELTHYAPAAEVAAMVKEAEQLAQARGAEAMQKRAANAANTSISPAPGYKEAGPRTISLWFSWARSGSAGQSDSGGKVDAVNAGAERAASTTSGWSPLPAPPRSWSGASTTATSPQERSTAYSEGSPDSFMPGYDNYELWRNWAAEVSGYSERHRASDGDPGRLSELDSIFASRGSVAAAPENGLYIGGGEIHAF